MTISQAYDLALQRHQAGHLADAEALYRQILAAQPNHADALHLLGLIAHQTGSHEAALEWIGKAVALEPSYPAAHANLGEVFLALGRRDDAIASHRRALALQPDYLEAHNNLANALRERGQLEEAIASYRRALALRPDYVEVHSNLGNALREQGRLDESVAACRRALALQPGFAAAHNNLGNALKDRGQSDEAIAAYRKAIALCPRYPEAHNNLATALVGRGELDEAIASFRLALAQEPSYARAHSNLICALHFHPHQDAGAVTAEQQRWNRQFSDPVKPHRAPHANVRDPQRRLMIGYVSPDFRDHVIGRNLLPLFEHHDRQSYEIICYSGVTRPDVWTAAFRRSAHHWRDTLGVSDDALAAMIRHDGVDILVDLTQHLEGNRLPMFARQPAPIQVSFAGYPETTGLDAIQHRISDAYLNSGTATEGSGGDAIGPCEAAPVTSVNEIPAHHEELFLIDSFWCYDPRGAEPPFNELPATQKGCVTFGSLGNFSKVNPPLLKLWARVLGKVKDSRLVILSPAGSHRQRTLQLLASDGVETSRVEFVEPRPRLEYLELYHRLDIVLDTFPYNGHTTSLDALWMGVPVVSLTGSASVSRAGLSQLTNLGLPELVAHSEEEYISIAVDLAGDLPRLAELRAALRSRMQDSPLMNAPRFARQIERAYREMWQAWVRQQDPSPHQG